MMKYPIGIQSFDRFIRLLEHVHKQTGRRAVVLLDMDFKVQVGMDDPRKLYRIGVSFSSETGTVEEWEMAE